MNKEHLTNELTLTPQQAKDYFKRWLELRISHQKGYDFNNYNLHQLIADIDHSALLNRLLNGKEPLPFPPPVQNSYPVYPDN